MINAAFGWVWICGGLVLGSLLGPGVQREDWMGGYTARRRRLLRLAHIAMVALGMLNVVFAVSVGDAAGWVWFTASWALVVGAVAMPACCVLSAWRKQLHTLFALPVLALIAATALACAGEVLR